MKVFLTGFMYCGKTTIGKRLAKKLGFTFVDTDFRLRDKHQMEIEDMFRLYGEDRFRIFEKEVLDEFIETTDDVVISLGGGTSCFFDNMQRCKENGIVIFLDLPLSAIIQRNKVAKTKRPVIANVSEEELPQVIESLYAKRLPYYQQAHIIYSALNADIANLAQMVLHYNLKTI
jgi:shikimate kinase